MEKSYLHIKEADEWKYTVDLHGTAWQMLLCLSAGIETVAGEVNKDWRVVAHAVIKLLEEKEKLEHGKEDSNE